MAEGSSPPERASEKREGKRDVNAKYAALTESVDDAVGTIMETLEETGVAKNTLVIFTSDNGGLKGPTETRRCVPERATPTKEGFESL